MMIIDLRDYGYGKAHNGNEKKDLKVTVLKHMNSDEYACPNCGNITVFMLEVTGIKSDLLIGVRGKGLYMGCAACTWASPMMIHTMDPDFLKTPSPPPSPDELEPSPILDPLSDTEDAGSSSTIEPSSPTGSSPDTDPQPLDDITQSDFEYQSPE